MNKLRKKHKTKGLITNNRVVLAALAGAVAGLAVTYFLESEKGRVLLSTVRNSVKSFTGNLDISKLLKRTLQQG
jgi:hypothetical protein